MKPACIRLPVSTEALQRYGQTLGLSDPAEAVAALARAISSSPGWEEAPDAVLLIRRSPRPLMAVIGRFDEAGVAWLVGQARVLDTACRSLCYLDYRQAEEDCERLAERLRAHFSPGELRAASFTAIPRGGLVVLGLLATVLGLERHQLAAPGSPGQPLVVVDDCAVTGARFRSFFGRLEPGGKTVFAHLCSHPRLREEIEREEAEVTCLSSRDLAALAAPEWRPEERARWLVGREIAPYWLGKTSPLAFSWGEPDRSIWNPLRQRSELAWRIVPPELCLKNRARSGSEPLPIQLQEEGRGPIKPSRWVLAGSFESRVVVHNVETAESVSLDSVGGDMWRAVLRHGNLERVAAALQRRYTVSRGQLREDLSAFTSELVARGFLHDDSSPLTGSAEGVASR